MNTLTSVKQRKGEISSAGEQERKIPQSSHFLPSFARPKEKLKQVTPALSAAATVSLAQACAVPLL